MWTYKTIWNICISDFTVASLLLDLMLTFTKKCAIGQMNVNSNKLKIWTNKMSDGQHGRCGCVSSMLSSSHYRAVQCKTIRNSWSYPSFDLCHMQTNYIILAGRILGAEDMSALLHRHVLRGRLLPLWVIGCGKPSWPLTPPSRLQQSERSLAGLVGVIYKVNI